MEGVNMALELGMGCMDGMWFGIVYCMDGKILMFSECV
jgi:hypothetical protein